MARGKAGKEELVGKGNAKLPDWEGQPIRNLRSVKLEREVRTRLSFIDARLFLSRYSVFLFLIPVLALPIHSFIHPSRPSSQPLFAFQGTRILPLWRSFGFSERLDINWR